MFLAAQVSIYPMRKAHLTEPIDRALKVFEASGLDVSTGPMSSIVAGEGEALFTALRDAFQGIAENDPVVMVVTLSNTCPVPQRG